MSNGRYRAYPEYKDSGVEWLGYTPRHWELSPLKYLAQFSGGGTPNKDTAAFWNGNIPWVSPKDMKGRFVDSTIDHVTPKAIQQSSTNLLAEGALLLVVRSGILQHSIPAAINRVPVTLNQDMKALRFGSKMTAEFAQYFVVGNQRSLLLEWCKQGATVESIEQELLGSSRLPIPPLPEQTQIAAFLDHETAKIDRLIEKQEELIRLLKEKRHAVISHAVTKGLNPHAPLKDSGIEWLGQVPAHWRVLPLRYLITNIEQGWSPQCENRPAEDNEWGVLKVGCGNRDQFDPKEQKALPYNLRPETNHEVKAGDILVSRGNSLELVGMATFIEQVRSRLLLSDLLYRFQPQRECADGEFLVSSLRSPHVRFQIESEATGTSPSMKKIGQENIRGLIVATPPLEEQRAIVKFIKVATAKLDILTADVHKAVTLLQERRTALISAAVTGKIDVRHWQPPMGSETGTPPDCGAFA